MRKSLHRKRSQPVWVRPVLETLEARALPSTAPTASFTEVADLRLLTTATIADLNGDGKPDVLGALNDGNGNLVVQNFNTLGLGAMFANGRIYRDAVIADFNGDGLPDIVCNVYSFANDPNSQCELFINNGNGTFTEDPTFAALGLSGHGETIVVADFANNGYLDIFLPFYTFSYPAGSGETNAPQCYLLMNDGHGHFHDIAVSAGVALQNIPLGHQPEGAEALDLFNNGWIDLYAAGHLFRNNGVVNGNLTFTDVSSQVGLPEANLFDEGIKFIDYNNDGLLDLVVLDPTNGPEFFRNNGTTFVEQTTTSTGHPFFSTGAPNYAPLSWDNNYGINAYDLNNDGLEDLVVTGGTNNQPYILMNTGDGFVTDPITPAYGAFQGLGNGNGSAAFGDFNGDGWIDMLYPDEDGIAYFTNTTGATSTNSSFVVNVLGPNGQQNEFGRVVTVNTPGGGTMTRVVDGGSGYMAQDQYPILVGTPYAGLETVNVTYPSLSAGAAPVVVSFKIAPGQTAQVYAPSAAFPNGHYTINSAPAPAPPFPPPSLPLDTIGVYDPLTSTFNLRTTNAPGLPDLTVLSIGMLPGDIPLAGDWFGKGSTAAGYYRPSTSTFYLLDSNVSETPPIVLPFGLPGDIPVVGDWTGQGFTTVGVYRPSTQTFYLRYTNLDDGTGDDGSGAGEAVVPFGNPGDVPVVGDWNGDGITTVGVFRPSQGTFYLRNSNTAGPADVTVANIGATASDLPVVGDWSGNGVSGVGYYRPSNATFYLGNSNASGAPPDYTIPFGNSLDLPLAGHWTGIRVTVPPTQPSANPNVIALPDSGFEAVNVGTGETSYRFNPSGSPWRFTGNAGLAGNGSAFTSGNPPAPTGTQVAFLQTLGSISQTVTLAAGTYKLSFLAAQRQNQVGSPQGQTFQVLVDGMVVGSLNPVGTNYALYCTGTFTVAAGAHTILIQGTNLYGGDNTIFLDQVQAVLLAPPAGAGAVSDGSFESVPVGTGQSAYRINPSGSAWTFDPSSGLAGNGSAFTGGNPPAPAGTQVAYLQTLGTIRQAVTLTAGTYKLTFSAAQRANYVGSPQGQTFQVLVDGLVVGSFNPGGTSYASYSTGSFTVAAGAHTLLFKGTNLYGGDNTAFLDQVQLLPVVTLPPGDPSFEALNVGSGPSAYRINPSGSAWTFDPSSGLAGNGSAFTGGNPPAPDGTQVAYLQTLGTIRQTVNLAAGTYSLSFYAAQRANFPGAPQGQTFQVLVDGLVVGSFNPVGTSYASYSTANFTLAAGAHTLLFKGTNLYGGDNTIFLDQVQLLPMVALPLGDPSFEVVNVGSGASAFQYNPSGSPWTFSGSAGLAGNSSNITSGNPVAPDGTQVAFLEMLGSVAETVTLAPGTYTLNFCAAQRQNLMGSPQGQTFQVLVDGTVVGNFNPSAINYASYATNPFTVTAGAHTLLFKGTNLYGGDNTVLLDQVQLLPVAVSPLGDPSFEAVNVGSGRSAWQFNPSGSAWTFDTSSGVSGNGSSFTGGNPPAPDGTQLAFIQTLGTFRQTIALAAGTYTLSFFAAQRANYPGAPQGETFQVLVDGLVVGSFDPNGTSYTVYNTNPITVATGAHTLLFKGTNLYGGDNTVFIDQVQLLPLVQPLGDPSFEAVNVGTGPNAYQFNPSASAWTFDASSGLAGNGSAFTGGNPPAPDGTQVAFLQTLGTMRQTVNLAGGSYTLSFSAAQRGNFLGASQGQTFQVLVDGMVVGNFNPTSTSYATYSTGCFTVAAGAHTILFKGTNLHGGDNTAFIDLVQLISAPKLAVTSLSTTAVGLGTGGLRLVVNGTGFVPNTMVSWNGMALATILISSTQLLVLVPPPYVAVAGTVNIMVTNPAPFWGVSNALSLLVQ